MLTCQGSVWIDRRFGDKPRFYLSPPKDARMRVPDIVIKSACSIGKRKTDGTFVPMGSGFFAEVPFPSLGGGTRYACYFVTARHVLLAIGQSPWWLRVNLKDGEADYIEAAGSEKWYFHPDNSKIIDVAVIPFRPPDQFDYSTVGTSIFLNDQIITKREIGVGDEVFMTGLFSKMQGRRKNLSIVRTGNIAMMPGEPIPNVRIGDNVGDMEAYLVEARSTGGLSGSPAFVRETVIVKDAFLHQSDRGKAILHGVGALYFLGLVHGHWEIYGDEINRNPIRSVGRSESTVNLGIALVVPANIVLEVLAQPELVTMRQEIDKELTEKEGTTTQDSLANDPNAISKSEFEDALKKVSRRRSPLGQQEPPSEPVQEKP